jgi:hypothetical protein
MTKKYCFCGNNNSFFIFNIVNNISYDKKILLIDLTKTNDYNFPSAKKNTIKDFYSYKKNIQITKSADIKDIEKMFDIIIYDCGPDIKEFIKYVSFCNYSFTVLDTEYLKSMAHNELVSLYKKVIVNNKKIIINFIIYSYVKSQDNIAFILNFKTTFHINFFFFEDEKNISELTPKKKENVMSYLPNAYFNIEINRVLKLFE